MWIIRAFFSKRLMCLLTSLWWYWYLCSRRQDRTARDKKQTLGDRCRRGQVTSAGCGRDMVKLRDYVALLLSEWTVVSTSRDTGKEIVAVLCCRGVVGTLEEQSQSIIMNILTIELSLNSYTNPTTFRKQIGPLLLRPRSIQTTDHLMYVPFTCSLFYPYYYYPH